MPASGLYIAVSSCDCSGDCAEAEADDAGSNKGRTGCGSADADAEEAAGAEEDDEEELDGCVVGLELSGTGSSSNRTRFGEASLRTGGDRVLSR